MNNGIILYQSKYGATKKYADWLAEATGFDCIETKKADIKAVQNYDTIILGGGVYASGIAGLSFLKKNIAALRNKKIAVFCVGASPYDEKAIQAGYEHNFKDALAGLPCFYCRGAWNETAMTFVTALFAKCSRRSLQKKPRLTWSLGNRHCSVPSVKAVTGQIKNIWNRCWILSGNKHLLLCVAELPPRVCSILPPCLLC